MGNYANYISSHNGKVGKHPDSMRPHRRPLIRRDFQKISEFIIGVMKKHNASILYAVPLNENLFDILSQYGAELINRDASELNFLGKNMEPEVQYMKLTLSELEKLKESIG